MIARKRPRTDHNAADQERMTSRTSGLTLLFATVSETTQISRGEAKILGTVRARELSPTMMIVRIQTKMQRTKEGKSGTKDVPQLHTSTSPWERMSNI